MSKCKKICLSVFVAVLTAFICIFGFSYNNNIASVSADSSSSNYEFTGSGFLVQASTYINEDVPEGPSLAITDFYYFTIEEVTSSQFTCSFKGITGTYRSSTSFTRNDWVYFSIEQFYPLATSRFFVVHYFISNDWVPNVTSLKIYSTRWAGVNSEIGQTFFELTDVNGNLAQFAVFASVDMLYEPYAYTDRTYYLTSDINDNDYYQTGYSNGFNAGKSEGLTEGQSVGYSNGFNAGKDVGFNEGVVSANDYSFLGLIGAVVDAPLNMFVQTFDFNILGFNMKDFFLSILTIALIFTIIRLCMGGKS